MLPKVASLPKRWSGKDNARLSKGSDQIQLIRSLQNVVFILDYVPFIRCHLLSACIKALQASKGCAQGY